MLLNVSLSNTNNHGEKQAKASNLVESINQCDSDAWSLQFLNELDMLAFTDFTSSSVLV